MINYIILGIIALSLFIVVLSSRKNDNLQQAFYLLSVLDILGILYLFTVGSIQGREVLLFILVLNLIYNMNITTRKKTEIK